jgi:hypothetical protein
MSRPGLEPGPPGWEASTLEKSHLDSLFAGYSKPLLMIRLMTLQTSTWLPQCRCIAHGLLSVEGMPEGDSKSASLNRTYCIQIAVTVMYDNHVGVTTIARPDQGHRYTLLEVPGLTCPGRGSNPGLLRGKRAL